MMKGGGGKKGQGLNSPNFGSREKQILKRKEVPTN
jgi:hypothetical protein